MNRDEKIREMREGGFNCAQSVLVALSDLTGLDEETALSISGCFGGGLRSGALCGAVSGAAMALGMAFPHSRAGDEESKKYAGIIASRLTAQFRNQHGDTDCSELLKRTAPKRLCDEYIKSAVEIAVQIFNEEKQSKGES